MQRATRLRKKKIKQVQSGIALSNLDVRTGKQSVETESFLTSRTARVLLAGAGFLADAVIMCICDNCAPMLYTLPYTCES